jgi:surface protein
LSYGLLQSLPRTPVYLDANGVTIKAHEWAKVGDKGVVNGIEYIVADRSMLENAMENDEPLSNYCTSRITSMDSLFLESPFNGDISKWDVSNVTDMNGMFAQSPFNGDISKWDVSNVTDMTGMFASTPFNGDISNWDVSNVTKMTWMFLASQFNGDISKWDVSNVTNMAGMLARSQFNGDISKWDVSNVVYRFLFSEGATYDFPKPKFTNCVD